MVRALWDDRDGNMWAGTNDGMARLEGNRFVTARPGRCRDSDGVRCLFEDREGNLWIGSNSGLTAAANDIFMVYGKSEGLPSDEPNTVFQDRAGRVWVGFNDRRPDAVFAGANRASSPLAKGCPIARFFRFGRRLKGDLLIATRSGVARMQAGKFHHLRPPDPLARHDRFRRARRCAGQRSGWLLRAGLGELRGKQFPDVVRGRSAIDRFRGHLVPKGRTARSGQALTAKDFGG